MRLYLTKISMSKIEYGSIENGYDKLILSRDGYPTTSGVPKIIEVDYWEVFDE